MFHMIIIFFNKNSTTTLFFLINSTAASSKKSVRFCIQEPKNGESSRIHRDSANMASFVCVFVYVAAEFLLGLNTFHTVCM